MFYLKRVIFIKNAIVLTVTALILRFAGILLKVWLAGAIGSEGIGLYQLVFSFYVFVATFATSGISTAVTRLVADELAVGTGKGALRILRCGMILSLVCSAVTVAGTFFGAEVIASFLLGDERAGMSIKILGFSLPFMAVCSCLRGYFIARRKTFSPGLSQVIDQAIRIVTVVVLIGKFASRGLTYTSAAVFAGDVLAELASCLFLFVCYRFDRRRLDLRSDQTSRRSIRRIGHIAVPITAGRYLNSGLRTAENILVPKKLALFSASKAASLSQFGMIKGMALPLLFFPASFLNSVSTLLVPEMSEAAAMGQKMKIRYATEKAMFLTFLSGFFLATVFFCLADDLSILIYKNDQVGYLMRVLAPIVPLMYIDSVADGMLKGLDKQAFLFRISVFDSALRILLILIFVKNFGMNGFLIIMVISNLLTAIVKVFVLLRESNVEIHLRQWIVKPVLCSVFAVFPSALIGKKIIENRLAAVIVILLLSVSLYLLFMALCRGFRRDDLADLIG